jgi:transcriptional regulator with XRE-family HTH domain
MNYKFLRAGRALLNWTQVELSVKAGVGLSALVAFESGSPTTAANIEALERALVAGGVIFRADGALDSAAQVLDRYASLAKPTNAQTAEAILCAGIVRRAGGRRAMPTGKAAEILAAARKARNEE